MGVVVLDGRKPPPSSIRTQRPKQDRDPLAFELGVIVMRFWSWAEPFAVYCLALPEDGLTDLT